MLDAETEGFVKVLHDRRGRVLGGTIVAAHAGEMIGELTSAVQSGTSLGTMASVIHPYPRSRTRSGARVTRTTARG